MIDKNTIISLLQTTTSRNLYGTGMEIKPYELALRMVEVLNSAEEYGYIVMGVIKLIDHYAISGVGATIKDRAKEPINTALSLISSEVEVEYENINIDGQNIFVIQLKNCDKTISMDFTRDFSSHNAFIKNLIIACTRLQTRKIYSNADENQRNDYVGDILDAIGYDVKDQTRRGSSPTGKDAGELDIFISKDRLPFTIIEALKLTSVDATTLNKHLDKIFSYDTAGTEFNVCLAYVTVTNFEKFWTTYSAHVASHVYPAPLISSDTAVDDEYRFSELRVMKTIHNRSGREVTLYHICVRIH